MRNHLTKRTAFTLTELLVVMALIVVLGAIGIGAVTKGYGWVKQRATETTMAKVLERIVQRRVNDINKEARDWELTGRSADIVYNQAGGDARRAEVLKVLYLYKWSFPQTYSEAWYNLQESKIIFDVNGYPHAQMIWERLSANGTNIITPSAAEMGTVVKFQASACLAAALATTRATSLDELGPEELGQPDAASGRCDLPNGQATTNKLLIDAWGNPLFFLRHGNMWDNLGYRAPMNRAAFWCGLVNPPVAPIPAVLGNQYYDILVMNQLNGTGRAYQAFSGRWNQDPFDPEGHLRNSDRWRKVQFGNNGPPAPVGPWLNSGAAPPFQTIHLAPPGGDQHQDYFVSNFGYWPVDAEASDWAQEFAPFVIISAGGDGLFTTWDDNLDSYRLKISVSGQQ